MIPADVGRVGLEALVRGQGPVAQVAQVAKPAKPQLVLVAQPV